MTTRLFEEFPPVTTEQWMEVVTRDLKGADFEKKLVSKTLDGIPLKPFYRAEDVPGEQRAARRLRPDGNPWVLREEVREPDVEAANTHARRCLNRGAQELAVYTYPIGPDVRTQEEMQRFLDGIWIEAVPIHWISGPLSPHVLAMLVNETKRRGLPLSELRGSVDLDPILDRCAGWTDAALDTWQDDLLDATGFILSEMPNFGLVTVRGAFIEKAGASLAQELGFTLAIFAEYLHAFREALAEGKMTVPGATSPEEALSALVARCELRFGVGTNYFLEIAKLRAARVLLTNLLDGYGVKSAWPRIHAITTSSNKTLYDPYNNLLRATVEAFGAVIGGADSLTVAAYDQGYHTPDEFSEHLARNTETLLKEEAYLPKVADPLGGSYTVEALTHSLAEAAWGLFRCCEAAGGFAKAWDNGTVRTELERVRAQRAKQVSSRRRTIVGTTVYPNIKEQRLADVGTKEPVRVVRGGEVARVCGFVKAFAAGACLDDWITEVTVPSTPLDPFRPSWPFENLRLRVERHVATGGKRPVVLLAMLGDATMRRARAGFCQGFFGAGGYDVREEVFKTAQEAADAAKAVGADALVLCSSDAEYPELVKGLTTDVTLVVAGYPQDALEELKAAGVRNFVHIKVDLLEALTRYHEQFGVPELPLDTPLAPQNAGGKPSESPLGQRL